MSGNESKNPLPFTQGSIWKTILWRLIIDWPRVFTNIIVNYGLFWKQDASTTKLTFYHIRCFLISKDAFTPNLAEFGPETTARATNLALNWSRIEILRVCKKLQNRQKLMTFWNVLNLWQPESSNFFEFSKSVNFYYSNSLLQICQNYTNLKSAVWIVKVDWF